MKIRHTNKILNIVIAFSIISVQSACAATTSVPPTETPGVVFVERSQWEQINNDVRAEFDDLVIYISENREEFVKKRAENGLDAQFCDSEE